MYSIGTHARTKMPESVGLSPNFGALCERRRENVTVAVAASAHPRPHAPKYDPSLLNCDVRYVCIIGSEVVVVDDVTPFAGNIFFFSSLLFLLVERCKQLLPYMCSPRFIEPTRRTCKPKIIIIYRQSV